MKSFLYNKSLKTQFKIVFFIILCLFVLSTIFTTLKINRINTIYQTELKEKVITNDTILSISSLVGDIQNNAMGIVINGEANNLDLYFKDMDKSILIVYNSEADVVDKTLFKEFQNDFDDYRDYLLKNSSGRLTSRADVNSFYNQSNNLKDKAISSLNNSINPGGTDVSAYFVTTKSQIFSIFMLFLIAQMLFIILAFTFYNLLSKGVVTRVKNLVTVSNDMQNGFISNTSKSPYNDEISSVTNSLIDSSIEMVETINNFDDVVTLAKGKNLNNYVKNANFTGNYETINNSMSDLIEVIIKNNESIAVSIENVSNGEFNIDTLDFNNDNKVIYDSMKLLVHNLIYIRDMAISQSENVSNGEFEVSDNYNDLKGDFYAINSALDDMINGFKEPFSEITNAVLEIGNGNLDSKLSGEFSGEFLVMKNSINNTIDSIKAQNEDIENVLNEISKGNLLVSTKVQYVGDYKTIEDSIKNLISELGTVIENLNENAKNIESSSKIIANSSTFLENDSMEEFSKISELEQKIDKVDGIVKNTDEKMDGMKKTAFDLSSKATDCNDKMNEMLGSMQDINSASLDISKIIKVIEEIAFQTNLLALNAAVESARAGVHGKGFAVVAEEVRNLAQRSQKAAKETTALIEHTVRKVSDGSGIANETANRLKEMIDDVSSITTVIEGVTGTTQSQSVILNSFKDSVKEISALTKNNIDHASNCLKTTDTLEQNVSKLNDDTKKFLYNVDRAKRANSVTTLEKPKDSIKPKANTITPKSAPIVQKPKTTPIVQKPKTYEPVSKPKDLIKPKDSTPLKTTQPQQNKVTTSVASQKDTTSKPFSGNIHQVNINKNSHSTHLNKDDNLPKADILVKRVEIIKPKSDYGLTSDVHLKDSPDKRLLTDDEIEKMISTKTFGKYL